MLVYLFYPLFLLSWCYFSKTSSLTIYLLVSDSLHALSDFLGQFLCIFRALIASAVFLTRFISCQAMLHILFYLPPCLVEQYKQFTSWHTFNALQTTKVWTLSPAEAVRLLMWVEWFIINSFLHSMTPEYFIESRDSAAIFPVFNLTSITFFIQYNCLEYFSCLLQHIFQRCIV